MGRYDVPATIDYVLNATGQRTLSFVGHSMGCALFYIAMMERPQYNSKIDVMISLAPTTSVNSMSNFFGHLAAYIKPFEVRPGHWYHN